MPPKNPGMQSMHPREKESFRPLPAVKEKKEREDDANIPGQAGMHKSLFKESSYREAESSIACFVWRPANRDAKDRSDNREK